MKKLRRAVRREQTHKLLASALLLLLGICLVFLFFQKNQTMAMGGLTLLITGIACTLYFARKRVDKRLVSLLYEQPQRIVWVYSLVTERLPFGFQFSKSGILYFKLADGDDLSISLPEQDLKMVSRFLNRVLPHATFGYSSERERKYRINPNDLINTTEPK